MITVSHFFVSHICSVTFFQTESKSDIFLVRINNEDIIILIILMIKKKD